MASEHYFSSTPESELKTRTIHARLAGRDVELTTANGVFSPERIDTGTQVLLSSVPAPPPGGNLLDLGCGSGLSTRSLLGAARRRGMSPRIIAVDASEGMLAHARRRRWPEGVVFVQGMAESLPAMDLPPAHGVLACYLLRNVTDLDATLRGIVGCLAPGAPFVAEDYSVRAPRQAQARWHLVNRAIIAMTIY